MSFLVARRLWFPLLLAPLALGAVAQRLSAADYKTMEYGPFLSGTILSPVPAGNDTLKGIAVKLTVGGGEAPRPEGPLGGGYSTRPRNDVAGAGPNEQELYKTQRFPCLGYKLNVPPGAYKLTLKFSDGWQIEPDKRVFGVKVQGQVVAERLDLIADVGRDTAHDIELENVAAPEGQIVIDLVKIKGDPSLAAIAIEGKDYRRRINCGGGKVGDWEADWPTGFALASDPALAGMLFDTELLRWSAGWTGGFLQLKGVVFDGGHGSNPSVGGMPAFATKPLPGWAQEDDLADPRAIPHGPLPRAWARYRGLHRHAEGIVLEYTVGTCLVRELATVDMVGPTPVFSRHVEIAAGDAPLLNVVADVEGAQPYEARDPRVAGLTRDGRTTLATVAGGPAGTRLEVLDGGRLALRVPPRTTPVRLRVNIAQVATDGAAELPPALHQLPAARDLAPLLTGGPALWPETVAAAGTLSTDKTAAYVADKIGVPFNNPYNSWMRTGGFDFLSDGRLAVCTWSGDVWLVSGVEGDLSQLVWKRYAAGLFHALGLKVVDDKIYVLGRDQITRLHDLNGDGEADHYECFNNDVQITKNFHEFQFELQTDPQGNFYFIKGGPVRPGGSGWDKIVPHHGCVFRVSPDGEKFEVVARGFRAPNGMGIGPRGEITSGDNEGTWTPACPLNWIRPGGFYGVPEFSAQDPKPTQRDNPLCWMPKNVDNSNGGQVWIPEGKFGPLGGALLHMSYGRCTLYRVLWEETQGQVQGGVVALPLRFDSGVMRGRFNHRDGCLYLCGLRGWQTNASQDSGLYRIRHTGQPFHFPEALRVKPEGLELRFAQPLDKAAAEDYDNYQVTQWNYRWTQGYGSKHYKPSQPNQEGVDEVEVDEATLAADGRTVLLKIADLKPVMQMRVAYTLKAADGTPLKQELHLTINVVGEQKGEVLPGKFEVTTK